VWELVEQWLRARGGRVTPRQVNLPRLVGVGANEGLAA
jgi:S-sulfosulfanyl-L-cysteine sulfohydrolase